MSEDAVAQIARAVLYEGYMLWPYRRSALKNQQRFTFGGVYPRAFANACSERSGVLMEALLEPNTPGSCCRVEITLRFLHLVDRSPLWRGIAVDELAAGGEHYLAWQEASERELTSGPLGVDELIEGCTAPFELPAGSEVAEVGPEAALRRSWQALSGELSIRAVIAGPGVLKLAVSVRNDSPWTGTERGEALARAFLSAHLVAHVHDGGFVSLTDPPETRRSEVAGCRSDGLWPVLVGAPGQRDTLLAAPMILGDYPSVAPESPGDLFDGGEIDSLLIHSLQALTDAERDEIRATDPRVRELLDRSLGLPPERMLSLYGAVREMRSP
jgi:hydrogenase maturation protease